MIEQSHTTGYIAGRAEPAFDPRLNPATDAHSVDPASEQRILLMVYCVCCGILGGAPALLAIAWCVMILSMSLGLLQAGMVVLAAFLCSVGIGYLVRHNRWAHWALFAYGGLVVLTFVGCAVALIVHAYVNQPDYTWLGILLAGVCLLLGAHGLCGVAAAACGRSMRRRLKSIQAMQGLIVCETCSYDLRGSIHSDTCPECGDLIQRLGQASEA